MTRPTPIAQLCLHCGRYGLELGERRCQVFDDLSCDDIRGGQVVEVVERLVLEPGDLEFARSTPVASSSRFHE